MIPISLRVRGVTVLNDVFIDFTKVTGDIIALTGENGQGKTSLMESMFMALYRTFPSRPDSVYTYCRGRDALVEFKFDWQGKIYKSVLNIDAVYSKMEAFLYDDKDAPLPGITGKTKDYDQIVEKLFGSPGMILASSFAAQNKEGNFLKIAKIDRKNLFIKMLNLGLLQVISKDAGSYVSECDKQLSEQQIELNAINNRLTVKVPDIPQMMIRLSNLEADYSGYSQEISRLQESIGSFKANTENRAPLLRRVTEEKRKVSDAKEKLKTLQERLESNQKLLELADSIRAAVQQISDMREEENAVRIAISQLTSQRKSFQDIKERYDTETSKLRECYLNEQSSKKLAEKTKADSEWSVKTIQEVPCQAEGDYAKCQFLIRALEAKEQLASVEVEILNYTQAMLKIQADHNEIAKPDLPALANIDEQIKANETKSSNIRSEIKKLEPRASLAAQVVQANAKIEEITEQIKITEQSKTEILNALIVSQDELAAIESIASQLVFAEQDLADTKEAKTNVDDEISLLKTEITKASTIKTAIEEEQKKLNPITLKIMHLEQNRKEWFLLAEAFGPKGIQSLEIDAAGPTVSGIANDLLYSCYGPRFSLKFITQEMKADQTGYKDEFDALVMDSERGREGSVSSLSGGEQIITGEAIGLAVSIFNKMKSGVTWHTLFRDEVTGSLDDDKAQRYISMIRRAREVGHFNKVLFIAHQDRIKDLADSRIIMNNGQASIC